MSSIIWIGIGFCVSQSAMFSGLNLAFFSISRLTLEIESQKNNRHAMKVAKLRKDSNFLLTTILWGNVGINVLLTLLSNSVMAGVTAFVFSTFVITTLGEIVPQAYFSRHALKMASLLSPILSLYQVILYPVAKPTAFALDKWLGGEGIQFFQEKDLREMLKIHMSAPETDIERVEGRGALNFLSIDDAPIGEIGEAIDPQSVISLPFDEGQPVFPKIGHACEDAFLQTLNAAGKKWVILTDTEGEPQLALDSDGFLRAALFETATFDPCTFCHRPIVVRRLDHPLGEALVHLTVVPERTGDDVIDEDLVIVWGDEKRIITGADILGRLLRGIASQRNSGHRYPHAPEETPGKQ